MKYFQSDCFTITGTAHLQGRMILLVVFFKYDISVIIFKMSFDYLLL